MLRLFLLPPYPSILESISISYVYLVSCFSTCQSYNNQIGGGISCQDTCSFELQSRLDIVSQLVRRTYIIIKAHVVKSALITFQLVFTSLLRNETWIFMLVSEMVGNFLFHLICEWFIWIPDYKSSSIYLKWIHWYLNIDYCTSQRTP